MNDSKEKLENILAKSETTLESLALLQIIIIKVRKNLLFEFQNKGNNMVIEKSIIHAIDLIAQSIDCVNEVLSIKEIQDIL